MARRNSRSMPTATPCRNSMPTASDAKSAANDDKPLRLPYFRHATAIGKGVMRPQLRGQLMAKLLRPWCVLAVVHCGTCLAYEQRRELPMIRACVWLSTIANLFISDKYHNSDRALQPSLELELFWLRCDFVGIAAVLFTTFALWSAHFGWHGILVTLTLVSGVCTASIATIAFGLFERGSRRGANAASTEGAIKLLLAVQFVPCFGYMVWQALQTHDCGGYTLIWFIYLPGVVLYALQWPADGALVGAHDYFHLLVVCGHLLSSWFDMMNARDACHFVSEHVRPPIELPPVSTVVAPPSSSGGWLATELRRVAALGLPAVIQLGAGSPLLPRWTAATLAAQVPLLTRVYTGPEAHFGPYYDEQRPLARAGLTTPLHNYSETSLTSERFFAAPRPGAPFKYAYYSGEVERDLTPLMHAALEPLETALIALRPSHASVNLWMGSAPVVTPCHYDGYHNAMVQLDGRKRWVLAPPSAWAALRAFPFLHPSHAQCQARLAELEAEVLAGAGAQSVELTPGDVLYVPPLYFHETTATSKHAAIGVNGWAACDESETAEAIFQVTRPPPAHVASGRASEATTAAALVLLLSQRTFGDAWHLPVRVWQERYASLDSLWHVALPEPRKRIDCALLGAAFTRRDGSVAWQVDWGGEAVAVHWATKVATMATGGFGEGTRATWLANLAELVAAERVSVAGTAVFWRELSDCHGAWATPSASHT